MRLGMILDVGVRILRRHWSVMLVLALLFAGPGALLTAATGIRFNEVALDIFPGISDGVIDPELTIGGPELDRLLDALAPYVLASLVAGVLASLGALAFSLVVADDYHARPAELGPVLRTSLRRVPSALVFILLTSLLIVGVAVLGLLGMSLATTILPTASIGSGGPGVFIALVIGVALVVGVAYLTMRWAPAFPAMVNEDLGWRGAMSRSWYLSGDNVWRIFVIAVLAALITAVGAAVLSQLLALLLVGVLAPTLGLDELVAESVALALGTLLLAPLAPVLTAVLYFDLRARRDAAAPDLVDEDRDR